VGRAEAQLPLVHAPMEALGGYDLDVDTAAATPEACARQVQRFLADAVPAAVHRLRTQWVP
jgi:chloramphenicol 3-O-phosphotransferase